MVPPLRTLLTPAHAAGLRRAAALHAALVVTKAVPDVMMEVLFLSEALALDVECETRGDSDVPRGLTSMSLLDHAGAVDLVPWDSDRPACCCVLLACESAAFLLPFLRTLGVGTLKLFAGRPGTWHVRVRRCFSPESGVRCVGGGGGGGRLCLVSCVCLLCLSLRPWSGWIALGHAMVEKALPSLASDAHRLVQVGAGVARCSRSPLAGVDVRWR